MKDWRFKSYTLRFFKERPPKYIKSYHLNSSAQELRDTFVFIRFNSLFSHINNQFISGRKVFGFGVYTVGRFLKLFQTTLSPHRRQLHIIEQLYTRETKKNSFMNFQPNKIIGFIET